MKTLTQSQYHRHDMMTWSLAIALFIIIMLACMTSCNTNRLPYSNDMSYDAVSRTRAEADSLSVLAQLDTVKWNELIRLTNLPGEGGDASCDSIFTMLYGFSLEFK